MEMQEMGSYIQLNFPKLNEKLNAEKTEKELTQNWGNMLKTKFFTPCEKCESGYIRTVQKSLGWIAEPCSCYIEYLYTRKVRELAAVARLTAGVITRYKFEEYKPVQLSIADLSKISTPVPGKKNWLFLYGNSGSGKTYSAYMALYISLLYGRSAFAISVADLLDKLRPQEEGGEDPAKMMHLCKNVKLLVLDDIGHEKSSQWVRERLYIIINHRWLNMLPTIFTSNFPLENLKSSVSDAVYSRVKSSAVLISYTKEKDKRIF